MPMFFNTISSTGYPTAPISGTTYAVRNFRRVLTSKGHTGSSLIIDPIFLNRSKQLLIFLCNLARAKFFAESLQLYSQSLSYLTHKLNLGLHHAGPKRQERTKEDEWPEDHVGNRGRHNQAVERLR